MGKKGKKGGKKGKKGKKSKKPKVPIVLLYYGTGVFQMENGDVYEGEYCAHRIGLVWREGRGVYTTHDGQIYEGNWKNDKLVENEELIIKYVDGTVYLGRLIKDKYNGPATYTVRDDVIVSMIMTNNQPTGQVIMIDKNENLWYGMAVPEENRCFLLMQNYFFENINEEQGRGIPKILHIDRSQHPPDDPPPVEEIEPEPVPVVIEPSVRSVKKAKGKKKKGKDKEKEPKEEEPAIDFEFLLLEEARREHEEKMKKIFNREKEEKIFKKTQKTVDDIDFTKSPWYQNFLRFILTKTQIIEKLQRNGPQELTKAEKEWCRNYKDYKEYKRLLEYISEQRDDTLNLDLMKKFWSKDWEESSKPIKVMYPRKDWDMFYDTIDRWWNEYYVPAKRKDQDVFDSSVSSSTVRNLLKSSTEESVETSVQTEI